MTFSQLTFVSTVFSVVVASVATFFLLSFTACSSSQQKQHRATKMSDSTGTLRYAFERKSFRLLQGARFSQIYPDHAMAGGDRWWKMSFVNCSFAR